MSRTVRAARLQAHGEPLVVDEVELAAPEVGEVVVEMTFGGVNPVDRYNALGSVGADLRLPRTVGAEGAGFHDGQPVVVRGSGIWATSVVVPSHSLVEVPAGVDLAAAAALGVAGVTAWRCVTELGAVQPADRVLVLGASGGVGSMIVSMAHRLGAAVCGQTTSPGKAAFLSRLGADQVAVADSQSLRAEIGDFGPTVVFDPLGGGFTGVAVEALEPRGRLILLGTSADTAGSVPLQAFYRKSLRMAGYGGLMETGEALAAGVKAALQGLAEGRFEVVVDSVVPLQDVNTALARLVDRSVSGKLLLDLGS